MSSATLITDTYGNTEHYSKIHVQQMAYCGRLGYNGHVASPFRAEPTPRSQQYIGLTKGLNLKWAPACLSLPSFRSSSGKNCKADGKTETERRGKEKGEAGRAIRTLERESFSSFCLYAGAGACIQDANRISLDGSGAAFPYGPPHATKGEGTDGGGLERVTFRRNYLSRRLRTFCVQLQRLRL